MISKLNQPDWIKDRVRALAQAGYIVIIPEAWMNINQWRGAGWAMIEPTTGLGGYIIAGGLSQNASGHLVTYGGVEGVLCGGGIWLRGYGMLRSPRKELLEKLIFFDLSLT